MRQTKTSIDLSVVIPMYNEEDVVEQLYARLTSILIGTRRSYEIIFVEDGSRDNTFAKLKKIMEGDYTVKLIKLRGNFGQTPALAAGFDNVAGNIIIAMDGDLQHLPEDIPKFIEKIDEGYDLVSGWRENRKDPFLTRRLPSKIANWLMYKISGVKLQDFGTTFKAYKREIMPDIHLYGEFHRFIPVLASRMKARIAEVPIENIRQEHRKSHYNITRTFTVFFDIIRLNFLTKFFEKPLQLFGTAGFILNLIGIIIDLYLIYMKYAYGLGLMEYRAPLFILAQLLIVTGFLFIILGLLAEMLVKFFHDFSYIKIYSIDKIYGCRDNDIDCK